jgi:hypothetical protein
MGQKSLWLVEFIITAIVLLVIGSITAPQSGRAESTVSSPTTSADSH